MSKYAIFCLGITIGTFVGFFIAAVLTAAREADDQMERRDK